MRRRTVGIAVGVLIAVIAAAIAVVTLVRRDRDDATIENESPAGHAMPVGSAASDGTPPPALAAGGGTARHEEISRSEHGRCGIEGDVTRAGKPAVARIEVVRTAAFNPLEGLPHDASPFVLRSLTPDSHPPKTIATTTSAADGHFVVEGVLAGSITVLATADDGAAGSASVQIATDGARAIVHIALVEGGGELRGRVVFADGTPFHGRVRVHDPYVLAATDRRAPIELDADGRFVATGLRRGLVGVTAYRDGEVAYTFNGAETGDAERAFVIGSPVHRFSGRVVADEGGRPVAGATILVGPAGITGVTNLSVVARATSDADGRFTIEGIDGAALRVEAAGFATTSEAFGPDGQLRLRRAAVLTGRVVETTGGVGGAVVPGVRVLLVSLMRHNATQVVAADETDVDGRFEFASLPDMEVRVHVEGRGFVAARSEFGGSSMGQGFDASALVLRAGEKTTIEIPVVRGANVHGRVLDADGKPVAGAEVSVTPTRDGTDAAYALGPTAERSVATDGDGRFRLGGLVPGARFGVIATAARHVRAWSGPFSATTPDGTDTTLRLPASRRGEALVLDAVTGKPVAAAFVGIDLGADLGGQVFVSADAAGLAVFDALPMADLAVVVQSAAGYVVPASAPLAAGSPRVEVRLDAGLSVEGVIRLPDGRPAVGVSVSAAAASQFVSGDGPSDDAGHFRVRGIAAGTVKLSATLLDGADWLTGETETTAGERNVVVALVRRPTSEFVVHVLDAEGRVVPMARASLVGGDGEASLWIQSGVLRADAIERDAVLEIWGAADTYGAPLPLACGRFEIAAGTKETEVRLGPALAIEGHVVDADGKPVAGAEVKAVRPRDEMAARGPQGPPYDRAVSAARTDGGGRFRIGGLGADEVLLLVEGPETSVQGSPPRVVGGARDVTLTLRPAIVATIRVKSLAGEPMPSATVLAVDGAAGVPLAFATTNAQGVTRLPRLDPSARPRLQVTDSGTVTLSPASRVIDPWTPGDTTVELVPKPAPRR
jgi:hypothetical protein